MFHKAINLQFKKGTTLELTFLSGEVKQYDMSGLFNKFPQLEALKNRKLFLKGKLMGGYGIIWNDELDVDTETIYEDGVMIKQVNPAINAVAWAVYSARVQLGITQSELAQKTGIDQSDISKIERGVANPSVLTLSRIANAMGTEFTVSFDSVANVNT